MTDPRTARELGEALLNPRTTKGDLEKTVEMAETAAALSTQQRKNLSKSDFVFPDKAPGPGSYPIHDRAHGANALSRSEGKPEESTVRAAVCKRYSDLPECKESD